MKKSLMALTVASVAANSALALDLESSKSVGATTYASEITISGTGIKVSNSENVDHETGFTITSGASRFFRYDLSGTATFIGNPTLSIAGVAASDIELSTGGDGESFVLYEVTASGGAIANNAAVQLQPAGGATNLFVPGTTTIAYTMYEFGGDGGTGTLAAAGPGQLLDFDNAVAIGTTTTNDGAAVEATLEIDVALENKKFSGGATTTNLGNFFVADTTTTERTALDDADVGVAVVVGTHSVTVDGDFSAAKSVTIVTSTKTVGCATGALVATGTINTDKTSVKFVPASVPVGSIDADGDAVTSGSVCLTVDGTTVIPESDYNATYAVTPNTGYTLAGTTFALNSLTNTGTTKVLNLTLTPTTENGVYKNYFRITNPSTNAGRVFIRLINDNGEASETIDMEDVYNDGVNTVAAGGSSRQFDIDAVYAAVQTADPTFSVGDAPRRKMRTEITGEFPNMDVQTYTVSTDQTTFSTF